MSHPANAELVPHRENLRRYREEKQMISYAELLDRIKRWESGDYDLEYWWVTSESNGVNRGM
jgi:hypothetical protein